MAAIVEMGKYIRLTKKSAVSLSIKLLILGRATTFAGILLRTVIKHVERK